MSKMFYRDEENIHGYYFLFVYHQQQPNETGRILEARRQLLFYRQSLHSLT